jgi:RNA polymerase sigma factor (sigma-70 family)
MAESVSTGEPVGHDAYSGPMAPHRGSASLPDPLAALYRDEYRGALRLAAGLLGDVEAAEEAVQDTFEKAGARLLQLDAEDRPAYLTRALLNRCRSLHRWDRAKKRRRVAVNEPVESVEDQVVGHDEAIRLRESLDALPFRQRQCLVLRYYLDLSDTQVAAALGISASSVKTHISRGFQRLLSELGDVHHG